MYEYCPELSEVAFPRMVHWLFPASRYDMVTLTPCAGLEEAVSITVPDIVTPAPMEIWAAEMLMVIVTW